MSLITIDRSLFTSDTNSPRSTDVCDTLESSSKSSQSEDFLMCKATAVGLNVRSRRRSSYIKPNDDIQDHLKKILGILRFGDYLQLVVRLQNDIPRPHHHRYCCVISTTGKQGTEESAILGVDLTDRKATIGLVLPIWQDMSVKLFGDGGFELITKDTEKQFKPVSVQALWAAFQSVNRACHVARANDYFSRGLTHDWVSYYHNLPASDTHQIQEWLKTDDIDGFNRYTLPTSLSDNATEEEKERHRMESLIRVKLQEIMYSVDLEEVTVLQLRQRLEDELHQQLRDYRHFIEEEVLTIYGRMDEASEIFNHLLLGTTFNASNRDELERRSVTHILNVTREVDNFFPGDKFEYKNIRVYDDEQSSLLPYFEDTHRFINEAKAQGTCCLVHCKMGISRSATTVIAYAMKEQNWDLETALAYVKCRRPCVQPNAGFMRELCTYQGILEASSNRHKPIFCKDANAPIPRPLAVTTATTQSPNSSDTAEEQQSHVTKSSPQSSPPIASDIRQESCRTNTHGSVVPNTTSSACDATLDLETELFAFKPQTTTFVDACLLATNPTFPNRTSILEGSASINEKYTACTFLQPERPITVWDFETGAHPLRVQSDRTTLLARNSHRLRQWHPDLVENIGFTDTTEFLPPRYSSSQATDISGFHHGDVQSVLPPKFEDLVDIPSWSIVCCREVDTLSRDELADPNIFGRCCVVRKEISSSPRAIATVERPVLMYTGVQEQMFKVEHVKGSNLHAVDKLSGPSLDASFMLRATKIADMNPVRAKFGYTSKSVEPFSLATTHVNPRLSQQVPTDRQSTHPNTISSTASPSFRPGELRSSYPPRFYRAHQSHPTSSTRITTLVHSDALAPSLSVQAVTSHSVDIGDLNANDFDSATSNFASLSVPTSTSSMFHSMRLPSRPQLPSPINRTQSARATVTQKLRPDNSWIVCPTTSEEPAVTEKTRMSEHRTRPISAICPILCSDSGNACTSAGSLLTPFRSTSVASDRALTGPLRIVPPRSTSNGHPRTTTLQLSTAPRIAPISIGPVSLSSPTSLSRSALETQSDSLSSDHASSCVSSVPELSEPLSTNSRDCVNGPTYRASFRPARRIVNWPPQTADPVATKS